MLRRTQTLELRQICRAQGGRPYWACEQPYYLKHAPANPTFATEHDGQSEGYFQGFKPKPMHHIARFRYNSQHRGAQPWYLRNLGGKTPHWLEVNCWLKMRDHVLGEECFPHVCMAMIVFSLVIWNLTRYLFFHPDLTIYNVIYYTMRRYTNVLRSDEVTNLDTPVFRWVQQPPEFYCFSEWRCFMEMGAHANDPYLEYFKSIGKEELLFKKPGQPGYNTAMEYLPQHKWGWSYHEKGPANPVPAKH